ncbi:hypothetical protein K474DRAFT_1696943 [Panus rudis PR-1116 ss-1]|nr:hypothetical protein K474DRAFT_1696943 [Panus rudis PR-1116 ss-1]
MPHDMVVTFLGTASGGGPTETRNCSSLVLNALGDGSLWMVDCAEGTVRQFALQPWRFGNPRHLKMSKVKKVFITHMHADHTMGIITLLRNVLGIPKSTTRNPTDTATSETELETEPIASSSSGTAAEPIDIDSESEGTESAFDSPSKPIRMDPKVEIYGPRGIRSFIRTILSLTHTHTQDKYSVHELLHADETPSAPSSDVYENELPGRDITADENGYWRNVVIELNRAGGRVKIVVDAGPIVHRDPCIGYIFREIIPPSFYAPQEGNRYGRNIVILGDTSDASAIVPLIESRPIDPDEASTSNADVDIDTSEGRSESQAGIDRPRPPVSLLVHEATDAFIPLSIDYNERTGKNRSTEIVHAKAVEKGHSTPAMAGEFAKRIGAERLVLNHIGARFPAPSPMAPTSWERFRQQCMQEIQRQADETWSPRPKGASTIAAWDYCTIVIPPHRFQSEQAPPWEREDDTEIGGIGDEMKDLGHPRTGLGDVAGGHPGLEGNFHGRGRGRGGGGYRGGGRGGRGGGGFGGHNQNLPGNMHEYHTQSDPFFSRGRGRGRGRGGQPLRGRGGGGMPPPPAPDVPYERANGKRLNSGNGGYGRNGGSSSGGGNGRGGYHNPDKRPRQ